MKILYAGFFVGEFGWHLMTWQAFCRALSKEYDYVTIGCESGTDFLYKDFADSIQIYGEEINSKNMWMINGGFVPRFKANDGDIVFPTREICLSKDTVQNFIQYGEYSPVYDKSICIHARATRNLNTDYRNWPVEKWNKFVSMLDGYTIYSIGSVNGAYHIDGTIDFRGIPLKELSNLLASTKCLVGPSSGAMHFGALCGTHLVVWSDTEKQIIGCSNQMRYEIFWNPLDNPVTFIPGSWNPAVETVFRKVENVLSN